MSVSPEAEQTSAGMSMGLLAGSTIISLTLIWGSVIAFGSHDFSDKDDTKAFTLTGSILFSNISSIFFYNPTSNTNKEPEFQA